MDDALRSLVFSKWKIKKFEFSFLDLLLAVCITGTGLFLRESVIEYTPVTTVKLLTIGLDYFMAIFCGILVWTYTKSRNRSFLTYAILVVYPSVVANSALWGQKSVWVAILFLLGLYLWNKKSNLLASLAVLAGGILSLMEVTVSTEVLTLGWPNVFELFGKDMWVTHYAKAVPIFLVGVLLTFAYLGYQKKIELTVDRKLQIFLFLSMFIPYFLPYMPAYAGYTADVVSVIYFMRFTKKFYIPMVQQISSYAAYSAVLNGETKLAMSVYALALLVILVDIGVDFYKGLEQAKER